MPTWPEIWNRRQMPCDGTILDRLIRADGFDSGAGLMSEDIWLKNHDTCCEMLHIKEKDSIFEVGCGAGAFLYPFYSKGHAVGGIDYSEPLVAMARSVMPDMPFEVGDAAAFRLQGCYDIMVANSVFQYFADLSYAERVLTRMIQGARKRVAVLDVPDARLRDVAEAKRKETVPEGEYETKYAGLMHMYYEQQWFKEIALASGCSVEILRQETSSYGNSSFRYHAVIGK